MSKKLVMTGVLLIILITAATTATERAFAATTTKSGVFGTVASINGSTITVRTTNGTSYAVNAGNAKVVLKNEDEKTVTATIADVEVGDSVLVKGTVIDTSVTAKSVFDGISF